MVEFPRSPAHPVPVSTAPVRGPFLLAMDTARHVELATMIASTQERRVESLVERAASGDVAAFAALVERFRGAVLAQARLRLDDLSLMEDVAQDSFLAAYTALRTGQLREPGAFAGWLRTIVRHQCGRVTRRRVPGGDRLEEHPEAASNASTALDLAEARQAWAMIRRAVALLPDGHRRVVHLYHLDERPAREVAESLDLPLTTVKKRLVDGRRKMKERLLMEMTDGIGDQTTLRRPRAEDWTSIGAAADAAAPGATEPNEIWLANRREFNDRQFMRRHYVAEDAHTGEVIAYGAVECASEPGRFRLFLVMDSALLSTIGERMYDKLEETMKQLDAEAVWVREYADDPLIDFLKAKGLQQRYRYEVPDVGELVVLKRELN